MSQVSKCSTCDGRGKNTRGQRCLDCNGTGTVEADIDESFDDESMDEDESIITDEPDADETEDEI